MLNRSKEAMRRWKGVDEAIDRWLEERHDLVVLLSGFAFREEFDGEDPQVRETMQEFITVLIDYVSAGHFEFYQKLFEEGREYEDGENIEKAMGLMECIENSTEVALAFDEKYNGSTDFSNLRADISLLGEYLETRFEAEDWMISTLHAIHMDNTTS